MLTPERIDKLAEHVRTNAEFARAIEAEVRKDDTELIRQLVEALTACRANGAIQGFVFDMATGAIKAGRARLEQPCA